MKNNNIENTKENKPYKMSFAIWLISEIVSVANIIFIFLAAFAVVGGIFAVKDIIVGYHPHSTLDGLPTMVREKVLSYRDFSNLDPNRYEIEGDMKDNIHYLKVTDRKTGEVYSSTYVDETSTKAEDKDPLSYGTLTEKIDNKDGSNQYSSGGPIYYYSEIYTSEPRRENGKFYVQAFEKVRIAFIIIFGFMAIQYIYYLCMNLRKGIFFTKENGEKLKTAGTYLAIISAVGPLLTLIFAILAQFRPMDFSFSHTSPVVTWDLQYIVAGALCYLLAEIIFRGTELQIDKDLTV